MHLDNTKRITSASYNGANWPVGKPEQSKTLTLGALVPSTVTPDSGKVLSGVSVSIDASIIKAENIAKDVTILGITGTHEGGDTPIAYLTVASYAPTSSQGADGDVWIVVS